jgi:signal peptidase I
MNKTIKTIIEYLLIIVAVIVVRIFVITPIEVNGRSMENTLYDKDIMILNILGYHTGGIKRFDIVVIKYGDEYLIKRVVGLPGEVVEYSDNKLYSNDKLVKDVIKSGTSDFSTESIVEGGVIPENKYFVLGDNRGNSSDSRVIGFIDKKLMLRLRDYLFFKRDVLLKYIKISLPLIASSAMWGIAQGAQTAILGRMGEATIAANSIASTVFQIISVVIYGAASATSVIIGKALGEGKREYMKEYSHTLQVIYIGLGLLTGAALFFFKDFIINFYNITPETYKLALQFMSVLSVTVIGTAYQMTCLTGIARGGGDTKIILINDTIHMWLIVIPAAALSAFVFGFSPVVVFICLKCDQILKCAVAAYWVNSYRWIKKI